MFSYVNMYITSKDLIIQKEEMVKVLFNFRVGHSNFGS